MEEIMDVVARVEENRVDVVSSMEIMRVVEREKISKAGIDTRLRGASKYKEPESRGEG